MPTAFLVVIGAKALPAVNALNFPSQMMAVLLEGSRMKKKDYLLLKKMHKRIWEKKVYSKREAYLYQKRPEITKLRRRYLLLVAKIHGMPPPPNHQKRFKRMIERSEWELQGGNYKQAFEAMQKALGVWADSADELMKRRFSSSDLGLGNTQSQQETCPETSSASPIFLQLARNDP